MYSVLDQQDERLGSSQRAGQLDADAPETAGLDALDPEFAMEIREALQQLALIQSSYRSGSFVQRVLAEKARQAEVAEDQEQARNEDDFEARVEREVEAQQTKKLEQPGYASVAATMFPAGSTNVISIPTDTSSRQLRSADSGRSDTWQKLVSKSRGGKSSSKRKEGQTWAALIAEQRGSVDNRSFAEKEDDRKERAAKGEIALSA